MNNSSNNFIDSVSQEERDQPILGPYLVKLEGRLESIEIKVMSLTKIVRLLQQYSEKKDMQYEKQTHNMQLVDSKLRKIDYLQQQLSQTAKRYDDLATSAKNQQAKLEKLNKSLKEKDSTFTNLQERIKFDLQEVNRKIGNIEATMLQNIRQDTKQQKNILQIDQKSDHYTLQQLSFRLNHLQAKVQADNERFKFKLKQLIGKDKKQSIFGEDNYGFNTDKKKSKSKVNNKQRQNSPFKRLRSK